MAYRLNLKAKNGFYTLKGYGKEEEVEERKEELGVEGDRMWPAKPKLCTIWTFTEKVEDS